jgi:hypothetical protein
MIKKPGGYSRLGQIADGPINTGSGHISVKFSIVDIFKGNPNMGESSKHPHCRLNTSSFAAFD